MLPFNLVAAVVVKKANIVYLSTQAVLDQLLTPSRAISNICFGVNCSLVSYFCRIQMSLLHRNKTRVSSMASVMRARFGRMINTLCEKTRRREQMTLVRKTQIETMASAAET